MGDYPRVERFVRHPGLRFVQEMHPEGVQGVSKRESVQEGKPAGEAREVVCKNQHAYSDHQCAARHLNGSKMPLEASVERKELIQAKTRQQKRNAQPHGV